MVAFLSTQAALLIPPWSFESDGWKSVQLREAKKLTFTEHLLGAKHWKSVRRLPSWCVFAVSGCPVSSEDFYS